MKERRDLAEAAFVGMLAMCLGIALMLGWRSGLDLFPSYGDLGEYFIPLWAIFRESLLGLRLPWWSEPQDLGFPFMANPQVSLFYLPNYILLLPRGLGPQLYLGSAVFIHAFGMYLLMRWRNLNRFPSAMVSCAFSTSGVFLGLHSMSTGIHTLAWAPGIVLLLWRTPRLRLEWLLLWGFLAQSILAGAWDVWIGIYPLLFLLYRRQLLANTWKHACGGIFAAGLILPQLLLTLPYLPRTIRSATSLESSFYWSGGLHSLLSLFTPNVVLSTLGPTTWKYVYGDRMAWTLVLFPGALILALFPLQISRLWGKERLLVVALVGQVLVACSGSAHFVVELFAKLGLRSPVRYPDKLLIGVIWISMLVAWTTLPVWLRYFKRFASPRILVFIVIWIASWPLIVVTVREKMLDINIPDRGSPFYVPMRQLYEYSINVDLATLLLTALLLLGGALFFRKKPAIILVLFAISSLLELSLSGTEIGEAQNVRNPARWAAEFSPLKLPPGRVWRSTDKLRNLAGTPARAESLATKIDGFVIKDLAWGLELSAPYQWSWFDGFNVLAPFYSRRLSEIARFPIIGIAKETCYRMSTHYVLGSSGPLRHFRDDFDGCKEDASGTVLCRWADSTQSKFSIKNRARFFRWDSLLVEDMLASRRDRSAIYFKTSDSLELSSPIMSVMDRSPKIASISDSMGAERIVHLYPGGDAWMSMATSWDPGWRAWVDGAEVPVRKADYALMGIKLPSGARVVEFRYRPKWFYSGLLAGIVLAGFGVLLLAQVPRPSKSA